MESGICIAEGVMVLFAGSSSIMEEGSFYQIASTLKFSIVLVVDTYGMGCSFLPLIVGFLQYDRDNLI